ncbi:hypothetical protein Tco_0020143 [Tanacetum coccineum]
MNQVQQELTNRPHHIVKVTTTRGRFVSRDTIRGKPLEVNLVDQSKTDATPHPPQITMTEGQGDDAVQVKRDKRDEEFTKIENNKELADIQATNILKLLMKGSGKSLQQQKEELFLSTNDFGAIGMKSIHDYFVRIPQANNDLKITQLTSPLIRLTPKFVQQHSSVLGKYVNNVKN